MFYVGAHRSHMRMFDRKPAATKIELLLEEAAKPLQALPQFPSGRQKQIFSIGRCRPPETVSKALGLATSCYDSWVAGTLYVPVPKAQEVYCLARLSSNKDKCRICAAINFLSLRDPDV